MARLINSINGPIVGKIGPVVGASWKGEAYIRSVPHKRSKKRQPLEKINQSNFATVHYWLQPILAYLRAGFKG